MTFNKALRTAVSSVLISLATVPAFAAFEDTGTGARAAALGGAYTALGDDTLSLFYNPAGLSRLRRREITTEYSQLLAGLSDGSHLGQYFMGVGVPLKSAGTIAFGWKQLNLENLYSERTLSLGYGQWLTRRLAAGAAVKQLYHSFNAPSTIVDDNGNTTSGVPTLFSQNGDSRGNFSADLGVLYRLTDRQLLGLSIQNINEPNVALDPNDNDPVPRTWRFGWAYQSAKKLSLTSDLTARQCPCDQNDYTAAGGAEKWWTARGAGDFAARGALAFGTRDFRQFSTGFGYRFQAFQLDYAFVFNLGGLGDTVGTHRFSLTYRFAAESVPATTPRGTPVEDQPVNILNVPMTSVEGESSYSLEQDSTTAVEPTAPATDSQSPVESSSDPLEKQ